jgi:hypothetical protein
VPSTSRSIRADPPPAMLSFFARVSRRYQRAVGALCMRKHVAGNGRATMRLSMSFSSSRFRPVGARLEQ